MWIPLYPLGFICEGVIALRDIPYFEETEKSAIAVKYCLKTVARLKEDSILHVGSTSLKIYFSFDDATNKSS